MNSKQTELATAFHEAAMTGAMTLTSLDGHLLQVDQTFASWIGGTQDSLCSGGRLQDLCDEAGASLLDAHYASLRTWGGRTGIPACGGIRLRLADQTFSPFLFKCIPFQPEQPRMQKAPAVLNAKRSCASDGSAGSPGSAPPALQVQLFFTPYDAEHGLAPRQDLLLEVPIRTLAFETGGKPLAAPKSTWTIDQVHGRYLLAARAASEGLWDWDGIHNSTFYSARYQGILGLSAKEASGSLRDLTCLMDPVDRARFLHSCNSDENRESTHFEMECRMLHADTTWRWMQMRCVRLHDPVTGQLLRMVGTISDVTSHRMLDTLTGLQNRFSLLERLRQRLADEAAPPFALLFIDLDQFKSINDSLSHWHGDMVLIEVARRIASTLASSPACFAARLCGDEFVVVLDTAKEADVIMYSQALQVLLQVPVLHGEHQTFLTASIGVALSRVGYTRPEEMLQDADMAMYRAKRSGRAKTYFFTSSLREKIQERRQVEVDLRRALKEGQLVLHYQPKVLLKSGAITGFEALIRWNHPTKGLLGPGTFIPIAEESELILELGRWTMFEAIRQASVWQQAGILPLHASMAVNLSARQFADYGLVKAIRSTLASEGLKSRYLDLEVTESALIEDQDLALSTLLELKELGVGLELDDFGMGYSSLSYLHRFPFDTLKVDRSFVSDMGVNDESSAIARSILALGAALNMRVIAEGVETLAQSERLQTMGCLYGQGFYFSPPLPASECVSLLLKQAREAELARETSCCLITASKQPSFLSSSPHPSL